MKRIVWTLLLVILVVISGCGTTPISKVQNNTPQPSQLPPSPQPQSVSVVSPIMDFNWVDLKDDKLSPKDLTADGKPDGHFHVTMSFAESAKIKYIIMRYMEFGQHVQWAWAYKTNVPIVGSPIAVFQNGAPVQQGTDIGLESSGNTDLDLYISELNNENGRDTFKFEKGQNISIQIKYITKSGAEQELDLTTVVSM